MATSLTERIVAAIKKVPPAKLAETKPADIKAKLKKADRESSSANSIISNQLKKAKEKAGVATKSKTAKQGVVKSAIKDPTFADFAKSLTIVKEFAAKCDGWEEMLRQLEGLFDSTTHEDLEGMIQFVGGEAPEFKTAAPVEKKTG